MGSRREPELARRAARRCSQEGVVAGCGAKKRGDEQDVGDEVPEDDPEERGGEELEALAGAESGGGGAEKEGEREEA